MAEAESRRLDTRDLCDAALRRFPRSVPERPYKGAARTAGQEKGEAATGSVSRSQNAKLELGAPRNRDRPASAKFSDNLR